MAMIQPVQIEQIEIFMDKGETDYFFFMEIARRFPDQLKDDNQYEVKNLTFVNGQLFFTLGLKT